MSFRIYQAIFYQFEGPQHSLWYREVSHDCFPMPGDLVELWDGGLTNSVHRRHYDYRMRAGVDLKHIVVKPAMPLPTIEHPWWKSNTPWRHGTVDELKMKHNVFNGQDYPIAI